MAKTGGGTSHRHQDSRKLWTSSEAAHTHDVDLSGYTTDAEYAALEKRVRDLEAAASQPPIPPQPPTNAYGPMTEPWFANPPAPPPGLADSGSLADAIAATPAGGVLNAAVGRTFAEDQIKVSKLITILGGRPGQPGASSFAPNNKPQQHLVFLGGGGGSTGGGSSGSVVEGFTGQGMDPNFAAPPIGPEYGLFQIGGYDQGTVDRITIRNCRLHDGMHDLINVQGGAGHQIVGNDLATSRKCCATISGMNGLMVRNNWAQGANSINATDIGDSAGMKILFGGSQNVVTRNRFHHNKTRGLWFDSPSGGHTIDDNDADNNLFQSLFGETLHDSVITNWRSHHNCLDPRNQGDYGGDIAFMCAARVDLSAFTIAWSGAGVTSNVDTNRTDDQKPHAGLHVHDGYAILTGPRFGLRFAGNPADTFWTSDNWAKNIGMAPGNSASPSTGTYALTAAQQLAALQAAGLPTAQ